VSTESSNEPDGISPTLQTEMRVQTVCQMIFAAFAVGAALFWLRSVLLPFILALFFVFGLVPVLDYIQRRMKAPRMVAVGVAFMLGLILITVLVGLIWLSVDSLMSNVGMYRQRFDEWKETIDVWTDFRTLGGTSNPAATEAPTGDSPESGTPGDTTPSEDTNGRTPSPPAGDAAMKNADMFRPLLGQLSPALMSFFSSALMVVIFMFFLLLGGSTEIVPRSEFWIEVEASIRQYIVTKTVISAVTGAVFAFVLWLFGVPLALVFGILAFLLNYIPNVGPVIAGLLPIPLIVLDPTMHYWEMGVVITLCVVVQFVSGNIIEPKMMGDSVKLHPVAILITLLFWGLIWGIVGMFLATPITAAIKLLLERFEHTKVIAQVLEGDLSGVSFGGNLTPSEPAS